MELAKKQASSQVHSKTSILHFMMPPSETEREKESEEEEEEILSVNVSACFYHELISFIEA